MNLRILLLLSGLGLLGFLFYPRSEQIARIAEQNWVQEVETVEGEPLHYPTIYSTSPRVSTYDLQFVYKIDKAELIFEKPAEQGPKRYEIWVSTRLDKRFERAFFYSANSREYTYSVQMFQVALEARWIQVVVNDWFDREPKLTEFKVGARFARHGPIVSETSNCNPYQLHQLTDGIASSASKWIGARRIEKKIKSEKEEKKTEVEYRAEDGVVVTFDLGESKRIYGTRLTTDGPGTNVKRYSVLLSTDGERYIRVYISGELEDKSVYDLHLFEEPVSARYVRMRIDKGDWYGDYPEMQEFEVFTDGYHLSPSKPVNISEYNAIQAYYDNCGEGNYASPNLVQGFSFDRTPIERGKGKGERGKEHTDRYHLRDGEEVEPGNTLKQKSFAYHYDTIIIAYEVLDPSALYWAQVTYLQEKDSKRISSLLADGFILHGSEYPSEFGIKKTIPQSAIRNPNSDELPRVTQSTHPLGAGVAETFIFSIPQEAYADGRLELHFNRLAGPNVVVSEVTLFEAYPRSRVIEKKIWEFGRATKVSAPVVVDGVLNEWTTLYPLAPLPSSSLTPSPPNPLVYLQWDADNLYLGVEVDRIALIEQSGRKNKKNDKPDSLDIFVDTALEKHQRMYTANDHHFTFYWLGAEVFADRLKAAQRHHHLDSILTTIPDRKEIEAAMKIQPKTSRYVLEARIPKDTVLHGFAPDVGKMIGFNYILKNPFAPDAFWASADVNAAPYEWREVELVSSISGRILIMDETATQQLDNFNAGDTIAICVWDSDRNTDRQSTQSLDVEISGDLTKDHRRLTLYETTIEQLGANDNLEDAHATNSELFAIRLKTEYSEKGKRARGQEGERKAENGERRTENGGRGTENGERRAELRHPTSDFRLPTSASHQSPLAIQGKERVTITYVDPYYARDARDVVVKYVATVNTGAMGTLSILSEDDIPITEFSAGDTLTFVVTDSDLIGPVAVALRGDITTDNRSSEIRNPKSEIRNPEQPPNTTITVTIPGSEELETVILTSPGNTEVYKGSLKTEYNEEPKLGDGVLQVVGTQVLTAQYIDGIQDTGRTNAPVIAEARVRVGRTAELLFSNVNQLQFSEDGRKFFNSGDTLTLQLRDMDINQDTSQAESATVVLTGNLLKDTLSITLTETGVSTGEFTGICETIFASSNGRSHLGEAIPAKPSRESPLAPEFGIKKEGRERSQIRNPKSEIRNPLEVTGAEAITATYIDALQGSGATQVAVTDVATVNTGDDGLLSIVKSNYITDVNSFNAGDTLYFRLRDADEESPYLEITATGDKTRDTVKVPIISSSTTESAFFGELTTEYGTTPIDDNRLQVVGGEQVTVTYIDKLQASGRTNMPVSDFCTVSTGHNGLLRISDFGFRISDLKKQFRVTNHQFIKAGDTLVVLLEDDDLNIEPATIQSFEVEASENTTQDIERIPVREIRANAGIFTGELKTAYGMEAIENDSVLQVQGHGVVTVQYIDALQETGATQIPIKKTLTVETGEKGVLELYSADSVKQIGSFSAGDILLLRLNDSDLNLNSEAVDRAYIIVTGNVIEDEVSVIVNETTPDSGIFQGRLHTQYSEEVDFTDDILQVQEKELITATYIDRIVGTGETNVKTKASAIVLSSSPGILLITNGNYREDLGRFEEIGGFNAGHTIYFWLEDLLISTVNPDAEVKITVNGNKTNDLATVFLDKFPDRDGVFYGSIPTRYLNTPVYDDVLDVQGGEEITAVYKPNFPGIYATSVTDNAYVNKGTRGHILIVHADGTQIENFNAGAILHFRLEDTDLNISAFAVDIADIWVSTSTTGVGKVVTLQETSDSTGVFIGNLKTAYGRITEPNTRWLTQQLGLLGGEIVTATYKDVLIDTGETNVDITDTCRANMIGTATYAKERVMVDGHADKWPLEHVMRTQQDEALMWAQWDADNLYLLVQIYDTEIVVPDPTRWYTEADSLEVHIDLQLPEDTVPKYLTDEKRPNTYILWFCPKGGGIQGQNKYAGQARPTLIHNYAPPIELVFRPYSDYYIMEIAIPFGIVLGGFDPLKTRRNDRIGFNYIIHRSDAPPVQWAQPAKEEAQTPPSALGILILERH